jgi:alkanesulfonate monooxygenase SsuD/methylene tetrahydromethanopterin reductase-like flavin-dependent oxidoreductase (luciferase family)
MAQAPLHLAVALDGAGWHPAAWREPGARPEDLFTPDYWIDLVVEAERGRLDFVTIEDAFDLQNDPARTDRVRGRLDAVLLAARIAPHTGDIGLVPTVTTTHTEPFQVATAIATLDYVSVGRAGWRPRISGRRGEAAHFGRREFPASVEWTHHLEDLFGEAADVVEVVRRLWDSWEDDAVIRDVTTGRFVDRDKLHHADFAGQWFQIRGPSVTPRPPQGQPLVTALAHSDLAYRFAAAGADVVYVTPHEEEQARGIVAAVREAEAVVGRGGEPLKVFADLVVFLDDTHDTGPGRRARLDGLDGAAYAGDAAVFAGSHERLADLLLRWQRAGMDGFRLRPGTLPGDLRAITRGLVPELRERGAFRREYDADTLRGLLGLPRPANRYVA